MTIRTLGRTRRVGFGLVVGAFAAAILSACGGGAAASPSPAAAAVLFVDADTVLGPKNLTEAETPTKVCVQANRFARNEEIVWRVKVFDPATGKPMDDTALTTVEVRLPNEALAMHYGPHPRQTPVDNFWTVAWDVPSDYPTGALPYTIVATAKDGRSGTYEEFKVSLAQLTVTEDVRPIVPE